jgi:hypothetical protein
MLPVSRTARTSPALVRWSTATRASLAVMRAALRAQHPRAGERAIERLLTKRLARRRARKLADYQRNA